MPFIFLFSLLFFSASEKTAPASALRFHLRFGSEPLTLDKPYAVDSTTDSVSVTTFRMYVSNITLQNKGKTVRSLKKSPHLLDAEHPQTFRLSLDEQVIFDAISFDIGVDSLTHVSANFEGDLDPIHGMYWTWQSGFINWKIEGHSKLCTGRNNRFQWHIGGYRAPWQTLKPVVVFTGEDRQDADVDIDLSSLLTASRLRDKADVMSPGPAAAAMASQLRVSSKPSHESH